MRPSLPHPHHARPTLALQVSDKERKQEFESLFKDVAGVLVEKCVNPATSRPYTLSMLERALRDIHFNPDPKKAAKQQALEVRAVRGHAGWVWGREGRVAGRHGPGPAVWQSP